MSAVDVARQLANDQLARFAFAHDAAIGEDADAHIVLRRFLDRLDRPKLHAHLPAQLVFLGPAFGQLAGGGAGFVDEERLGLQIGQFDCLFFAPADFAEREPDAARPPAAE